MTKDVLVQGSVGVVAGILTIAGLFMPWLAVENSATGFEIGDVLTTTQAVTAIPMTLLILGVLIIAGGVMHLLGYPYEMKLATATSLMALLTSIFFILTVFFGVLTHNQTTLTPQVGPWISILGSIFGVVSPRLKRTQ